MTKKVVDYSNTIIYKIACKNKDIKDIYVGHTTNFIKRKYQHKLCCKQNLKNNKVNNCKIYKTINENGGWDNWEMIELETLNCKTLIEAKQKEQEYYNLLNASLNSIPPYLETNHYYCNVCNKNYTQYNYNKHINTKKHINNFKNINISTTNTNSNNTNSNNTNIIKFHCESCNYQTNKLFCWQQHINTNKHKRKILDNNNKENIYTCKCSKIFKHQSSFCRHKLGCKFLNKFDFLTEDNKNNTDENIILELLKQNNELKDLLLNHTSKVIELLKNNNSNP